MSSLRKFRPLSSRLFQWAINWKKSFQNKQLSPNQAPLIRTYTLTIASLAFIWPMKSSNDNKTTFEKQADQLPKIIESADTLFDNGHYEECYQLLCEHKDQQNVEIQWRTARVLYNMSKEEKYEKSYRKDLVYMAYDIVSDLVMKHESHYAVHKWYALLLDAKSTYEGIKERIKQLENVKTHMDLAVTLNPDDATILYMLGEWCYQISEMPWHQRRIAEILFASPPQSTYEDALEYFLRAETAQPRFYSLNLLRLGNCYLKLEKEDQAKYYLKLAASYPAKSNDDHQANKEASELLKKMR